MCDMPCKHTALAGACLCSRLPPSGVMLWPVLRLHIQADACCTRPVQVQVFKKTDRRKLPSMRAYNPNAGTGGSGESAGNDTHRAVRR